MVGAWQGPAGNIAPCGCHRTWPGLKARNLGGPLGGGGRRETGGNPDAQVSESLKTKMPRGGLAGGRAASGGGVRAGWGHRGRKGQEKAVARRNAEYHV